ncbi:MAG: SDR family oxidoreductase [Actinomycetota bacterium]|nr:SDR family oxidoreductase [Actinomycetota bacterium]
MSEGIDMGDAVVVTGASRGIGAAVARLLGKNGYKVAVNYSASDEAAQRVVADIERAGGEALAIQADVGSAEAVARMFDIVDDQLGQLSGLVNNAAVHGPKGRVEDLSIDALNEVLSVNVVGLVACSQHAVRRMSTRMGGSGGAIVNISSGAAYIGSPGVGVQYALSKGAVNSFGIGLSQEVAGDGIRVNTVSPGPTRTDMFDSDQIAEVSAAMPMGRVGEPPEIAEAVLWLLSDKASFVAGATIRAAGGRP